MRPAEPIGTDVALCKGCNGFGVLVEIVDVRNFGKLVVHKDCGGTGLVPSGKPRLTPHIDPVEK